MKANPSRYQETLDILQEECAEVIQAVSKIRRFGIEGKHPNHDYNNREHLEEEVGDMLAMIDILVEQGVVERQTLENFAIQKKHKLKF